MVKTLNYKTYRKGMGKGLGKGYKNIVVKDPFVHSMSSHGIKQNVKYFTGIHKNIGKSLPKRKKIAETKSILKIKDEIYDLFYNVKRYKGESAIYPEVMELVILKDKSHYFNFLKAHTDFEAVGFWKDEKHQQSFDEEHNTVIRLQYLDTKSGLVGKRLKKLLERLNNYEIGEYLLYFDTMKVDDTSLNLKKDRTMIIKASGTEQLMDREWGWNYLKTKKNGKKRIISDRAGIVIYIDKYGIKRWKHKSKKGAIYGRG